MTEYNDGFDRGYAHGYTSGYAEGRHEMLMELGLMMHDTITVQIVIGHLERSQRQNYE